MQTQENGQADGRNYMYRKKVVSLLILGQREINEGDRTCSKEVYEDIEIGGSKEQKIQDNVNISKMY